MAKEKAENTMFKVRLSAMVKRPTINGLPPQKRDGTKLPLFVAVAFTDDKTRRKEFKFFGDESHLMTREEVDSACYLAVPFSVSEAERENNPHNVNEMGRVKNPGLIIEEA